MIKAYRDSILAGHAGINATYEAIRRRYCWLNMFPDTYGVDTVVPKPCREHGRHAGEQQRTLPYTHQVEPTVRAWLCRSLGPALGRFDRPTSGLWAPHANRCATVLIELSSYGTCLVYKQRLV